MPRTQRRIREVIFLNESILRDIGIYKDKLISAFTGSRDVTEILLGENAGETPAEELLFTRIFPYLEMDESKPEELSYLCLEADIPSAPSRMVKNLRITVWAYCHKNCLNYSRAGYAGTRADQLADAAERALRNLQDLGMGNLRLESASYLSPAGSKYYGRQMIFTVSDLKVKSSP